MLLFPVFVINVYLGNIHSYFRHMRFHVRRMEITTRNCFAYPRIILKRNLTLNYTHYAREISLTIAWKRQETIKEYFQFQSVDVNDLWILISYSMKEHEIYLCNIIRSIAFLIWLWNRFHIYLKFFNSMSMTHLCQQCITY